MKKSILLIVILSITAMGHSFAQKLSIYSPTSALFPASCDSGFVPHLIFKVVYTGSTLFDKDTIKIKISVSNLPAITLDSVAVVDSLSNRDTLTIQYSSLKMDNSTGFYGGNDIVVIWPTGSGGIAITGDSVIQHTQVTDSTAGLAPVINNSFNVALYPNPTENLLNLNYDESVIHLGQVRIYNLLGRIMLTKISSFNTIDINSLPGGFYLLEAITTDKSRYITPFVKSQ